MKQNLVDVVDFGLGVYNLFSCLTSQLTDLLFTITNKLSIHRSASSVALLFQYEQFPQAHIRLTSGWCQAGARQCLLLPVSQIASLGSLCRWGGVG